jgi:hypothetical protein
MGISMELAIHLRSPEIGVEANLLPAQLGAKILGPFYGKDLHWMPPPSLHRIYIGDEFCPHRLPGPAELEAYGALSDTLGIPLTLLTPVLTDDELDRCSPLFDALADRMPQAEIVVNDWGVLSLVTAMYPSFRLAAGRVLDKGFKDPRLDLGNEAIAADHALKQMLEGTTFSRPEFQSLAQRMGIERLESDLLPYGDRKIEACPFQRSIYFPFGYITSGRICWIASFGQAASRKFLPVKSCRGPCRDLTLELHGSGFQFRVFQNGNTIFYLYTLPMMRDLLERASEGSIRLVLQGLSL